MIMRIKTHAKMIAALMAIVIFLSFAIGIGANAQQPIRVILDGRTLQFDVQPTIINDRTMVPMRGIFEALGANVEWNEATRTVTATRGALTVQTTIGNNVITVNGVRTTMDVAPVIVSDRTLVPVRFISEAFGYDVEWDGVSRIVSIDSLVIDNEVSDVINREDLLDEDLVVQDMNPDDEWYHWGSQDWVWID
ncbi:MAG: copper amine oxidase N-terminal domain-containing protein [Oscillospiraceae bacterium]|nr:copper amine oxidase N-terminal domain-containing protein [Oscillospiraceae bacterium]